MVKPPLFMLYLKVMMVLADDALAAFESLVKIEALPHGRSVRRIRSTSNHITIISPSYHPYIKMYQDLSRRSHVFISFPTFLTALGYLILLILHQQVATARVGFCCRRNRCFGPSPASRPPWSRGERLELRLWRWIGWWENLQETSQIFPWRSWDFPVIFP